MNVYETKQMYSIILYKIDVNYDIPLRNLLWRFSKKVIKWRRLVFVLRLTWNPYSNGEWKKCKITNDICLELRLHSLLGCQGLLNSQLSKKAKRDTTQMAKMTRIISHKWSRISKRKCCVYKACTHSLTTFGLPAFDKLFIIHFSSSWNSFCPYAWYALRNLFSKLPRLVVASIY